MSKDILWKNYCIFPFCPHHLYFCLTHHCLPLFVLTNLISSDNWAFTGTHFDTELLQTASQKALN